MPEIGSLEPADLRELWDHEARDFTPWLANHIDRLGAKLDLSLERVQTEVTLPGAGIVDIRAQQVGTGATVVIENQLVASDHSHCLRLLGYAANAEASILGWVARSFSNYHRSILEWLNEADTIDVYGVIVRAYRVGDALAADFQTVVEPPQSRSGASDPPKKKTASTLFAEFYRPLVARLRPHGIHPVGKGGWRGRWRSFQTGHGGAVYGTGLYEGKAMVFLSLRGAAQKQTYHALREHQADIAEKVDGTVLWEESGRNSEIMLTQDVDLDLRGPEEQLEPVRQWMADNLVPLRDAVQPHLDRLMAAADDDPGESSAAE